MPGLFLIKENERLTFKGDGFEIYYRRIDNQRRATIIDRHTKRGETNFVAASVEILEWCVIGWSGADQPFDPSLIKYIPEDITSKLADLIGANARAKEKELGNSATTSANNSTTEASPATSAG